MRRTIRLIILVPIGIVLIALALANRAPVTLSLDPFRPDQPAAAITVPLFVALFAALLVGLAIGGMAAWLGQGKWRRAARARARALAALNRGQSAQRGPVPAAPAGGPLLPALSEGRRALQR